MAISNHNMNLIWDIAYTIADFHSSSHGVLVNGGPSPDDEASFNTAFLRGELWIHGVPNDKEHLDAMRQNLRSALDHYRGLYVNHFPL